MVLVVCSIADTSSLLHDLVPGGRKTATVHGSLGGHALFAASRRLQGAGNDSMSVVLDEADIPDTASVTPVPLGATDASGGIPRRPDISCGDRE